MEFVTFAASPGIPHELAAPLLERGAPKDLLGLYRAADELTLLADSGGRQLVSFGFIAYSQRACLDPHTGAVVALLDLQDGGGGGGGGGGDWVLCRVNSSLEQFSASVGAVLTRYPFARPQAEEEGDERYLERSRAELDRVAGDLTRALRAIDPLALDDPCRFWLDFIDDVQMGNYSTDDDA